MFLQSINFHLFFFRTLFEKLLYFIRVTVWFLCSHINKKTTYTDPRLAFAMDVDSNGGSIRQRFDANATTDQVLQGLDLTGKVAIVTGASSGLGELFFF